MVAPLPTIAHVDAEGGFSGGEVQVFLLIEGLEREGFASVLFSPPGSKAETRAAERGIRHVAVRMRNDFDLPAVLELKRGFARCGAALAHLHTGRATWLGAWAARWAGVPAVTTRRMDREVTPGLRTRLVHEVLCARSVAISPAVADCLRRGGVSESRIRTIASAVDASALVPERPREAVRQALGAGPGEVVLLALGSLVQRKGFDVLLEALAKVASEAAAWVLWIAGDGPERDRLVQRRGEFGLTARVRFLGRRDDVADLLAGCDVVVVPSRREGLGVAALEAMAAGRPVVASAVGGLGQAVVDDRTGLLVPPDDVSALAEALARVAGDAALRARLGAQGRERVQEGYSAPRMAAAYAALYREVLAEAKQ